MKLIHLCSDFKSHEMDVLPRDTVRHSPPQKLHALAVSGLPSHRRSIVNFGDPRWPLLRTTSCTSAPSSLQPQDLRTSTFPIFQRSIPTTKAKPHRPHNNFPLSDHGAIHQESLRCWKGSIMQRFEERDITRYCCSPRAVYELQSTTPWHLSECTAEKPIRNTANSHYSAL